MSMLLEAKMSIQGLESEKNLSRKNNNWALGAFAPSEWRISLSLNIFFSKGNKTNC